MNKSLFYSYACGVEKINQIRECREFTVHPYRRAFKAPEILGKRRKKTRIFTRIHNTAILVIDTTIGWPIFWRLVLDPDIKSERRRWTLDGTKKSVSTRVNVSIFRLTLDTQ